MITDSTSSMFVAQHVEQSRFVFDAEDPADVRLGDVGVDEQHAHVLLERDATTRG